VRTAFTSIAIVLAALVGLAVLEGGGEQSQPAERVDVGTIAARVEALRGLTFREQPVPVRISGAQAREEGLSDLDRSYPEARRRADEEILKLLGLIEPDVDLRTLSGSVFGEGVAGYYDPRSKRLRIVEDATPGPLADIVLAHELNHALEDQRFGLALDEKATDDAALARLALVEGTAMLVMQEYILRHVGADEALGAVLGSGLSSGPELPKFVQDQLIFPYSGGMQFAAALRQQAGGGWSELDAAARSRIPESTEQILHPEKWAAGEKPERVRLKVRLGFGWSRAHAGTWGEWQTAQLVGGDAAGWGGDRYELWQRGDCVRPPCRNEDVLVMRWAWDTREAARRFEDKLRAAPVASGEGAAVAARGDTVTLVLAPSDGLARTIASDA
jgi:hypothetical protein